MRWMTWTAAATATSFCLACGGGSPLDSGLLVQREADEVENPTTVRSGTPGIEALSGTRIWIKTRVAAPSKDYCAILADKGLVVECDYGWEASAEVAVDNVMLKCGTLPDNTAALLVDALEMSELQQWDWRADPDYGVAYCGEMDAITLEIASP
ncbi:MAG: hypothetical protein JXX28_01955 [Deltaproteobacteria bacterium]|nr:hypothetical protein [Deltaproteobacteria bacterium]